VTLRVPNPQSAVELRRVFRQIDKSYARLSALNGASSGTITRNSDDTINTLTLVYDRDGEEETEVFTFSYTDGVLSGLVRVGGDGGTKTFTFNHTDNLLTDFAVT